MSFMFMTMTVAMAFVLSAATTPLTLGTWVLMFAFAISLTTSNLISSWFGLIIFLIYVGGLLVMFAYFSAVTPNQQLDLSPLFAFSSFTFILIMCNYSLFFTANGFNTLSTMYAPVPNITILFYSNMLIYLSLGAILFLALVAVVKVSRLSAGPLRPFM